MQNVLPDHLLQKIAMDLDDKKDLRALCFACKHLCDVMSDQIFVQQWLMKQYDVELAAKLGLVDAVREILFPPSWDDYYVINYPSNFAIKRAVFWATIEGHASVLQLLLSVVDTPSFSVRIEDINFDSLSLIEVACFCGEIDTANMLFISYEESDINRDGSRRRRWIPVWAVISGLICLITSASRLEETRGLIRRTKRSELSERRTGLLVSDDRDISNTRDAHQGNRGAKETNIEEEDRCIASGLRMLLLERGTANGTARGKFAGTLLLRDMKALVKLGYAEVLKTFLENGAARYDRSSAFFAWKYGKGRVMRVLRDVRDTRGGGSGVIIRNVAIYADILIELIFINLGALLFFFSLVAVSSFMIILGRGRELV